MTIRTGTWGFAKWGSAVWGRSLFGILASGNIVSSGLLNALNQATPAGQQINATITIDGTDQSEALVSFTVTQTAFGGAKTASLVFAAESVTGLVNRKSAIVLTVGYVVGGVEFSAIIFQGKPRIIRDAPNQWQKTVTVTAFDASRILDESAPQFTTHTGSAMALVRQELDYLGFAAVEISVEDYTVSGLTATNYKTVREIINALINGRRKAYSILDSDGIFKIYDATKVPAVSWSVPLSGQTKQQVKEQSGSVFNRVTAANGAGLSQTYNDTAHQADNGILETSITCPFCANNTQLLAYATQYAKESQTQQIELEVPLNPFIMPGQCVGIEQQSGEGITARVEEISMSMSWPSGAWHQVVAREIPEETQPVIVASPTTPIFDNKGYLWGGYTTIPGTFTDYYPEFTITREWTVRFIATMHQLNSTPGTITLIDVNTLDEFGPFTCTSWTTPWDGFWHGLYDEPICVLPAGTYRVVDSATDSWLVYQHMNWLTISYGKAIVRIGGD